jgi:hypothetical protein
MALTTIETAETAVRKVLSQLFAHGRIDLSTLTVEQRSDFVRHTAGLAGLAIATMPAVQEALAIARPTMTSAERYTMLVQAVARVFGLVADPLEPSEDGGATKGRVN